MAVRNRSQITYFLSLKQMINEEGGRRGEEGGSHIEMKWKAKQSPLLNAVLVTSFLSLIRSDASLMNCFGWNSAQ
jgi:hypothetical protein